MKRKPNARSMPFREDQISKVGAPGPSVARMPRGTLLSAAIFLAGW